MPRDDDHWFKICDNCNEMFRTSDDNWYRIERMHDDRIGMGTMEFCSRRCALSWLEAQPEIVRA